METVCDLFCGAGGLSTGFEKAGFKILMGVDSNEDAVATYQFNHKRATALCSDIRKFDKKEIDEHLSKGDVSVIIGGPPCEGFSIANRKTRSMDNTKNFLFKEFVKIVEYVKPQCVVLENVPGILTLGKGKIKEMIFRSFERIGYKFPKEKGENKYFLLNSADFGVPQIRRRVFFIASLDNSFSDILFELEVQAEDYLTVGDALTDLPPIRMGSRGPNTSDYKSKPKTKYQKMMRQDSAKIFNHMTTKCHPYIYERFKWIPQGGNWSNIPKKLMSNYAGFENMHSFIYKRLHLKQPSTIIANVRKSMIVHPIQNRLISSREAARLQSFDDRYFFKGRLNSVQEQIGDAVPVLLASKVAQEVLNLL